MTQFGRTTLTSTALLVLAVLFVALTMLSHTLLKGLRLDLTEDRLYTLSDGSRRLLGELDEPINLYYFYSDQASRQLPALRTYAGRVRELLDEYVLQANGQLKLHVIDPLPFSEDEDRAAQYGLQAVPVGNGGESLYFGLAGTNTLDNVEVITFFQPDKEAFLEYELSKLIYSLAHPSKPVIGLLSSLPLRGGLDPLSGQPKPPWIITEQLGQLFQIRDLEANVQHIDPDIAVLMLVHPQQLSEQTLYAIDQYLLGGGKALIFLDPYAEFDQPAPTGPGGGRSSDLGKLLNAWGIEADNHAIIGDSRYALTVNARPGQPPVRHLGIVSIDGKGLDQQDAVTGGLNTITLGLAGQIRTQPDAKVTLTPLISSSAAAMPIPADRWQFMMDPAQLQKGFKPTGERYVLAARVQGQLLSAFPDGPPVAAKDGAQQADDKSKAADQAATATTAPHRQEATAPVNLIIVADSDLLADTLWVRTQNFFGQRIATAWANNADFVANALDNLTGNNDLISIRGRATSARPFTTVAALEQAASDRLLAKEQELQEELRETERKLNELQRSRDDKNPLILSPEQKAELDRFQQRKLDIRKQLRQVRRDLDANIERLGVMLKVLNIGLVPLLLSLVALGAVWLRARHRRRGGSPA
jgi:ABC-type uncharacterized transport system involved in gliding motility auxiliary subunit